jgi:hypothetical protein
VQSRSETEYNAVVNEMTSKREPHLRTASLSLVVSGRCRFRRTVPKHLGGSSPHGLSEKKCNKFNLTPCGMMSDRKRDSKQDRFTVTTKEQFHRSTVEAFADRVRGMNRRIRCNLGSRSVATRWGPTRGSPPFNPPFAAVAMELLRCFRRSNRLTVPLWLPYDTAENWKTAKGEVLRQGFEPWSLP